MPLFSSADGPTPAEGCWLKIPSPMVAEVATLAGFDYLCLDMQHGFIDRSNLVPMLQAIRPDTRVVLVRVPANSAPEIGYALDAGATGVIVPMVDSAEDAIAAVRACRYPPHGDRSMGPTRAVLVADDSAPIAGPACIPMIETASALDSLDEILSVDGVDAVYVGPSDLSIHLGLGPGNNDGEAPFDEALRRIVESCRHHGVTPGIHASRTLHHLRCEQGFRIVTSTDDLTALVEHVSPIGLTTGRAAAPKG